MDDAGKLAVYRFHVILAVQGPHAHVFHGLVRPEQNCEHFRNLPGRSVSHVSSSAFVSPLTFRISSKKFFGLFACLSTSWRYGLGLSLFQ